MRLKQIEHFLGTRLCLTLSPDVRGKALNVVKCQVYLRLLKILRMLKYIRSALLSFQKAQICVCCL